MKADYNPDFAMRPAYGMALRLLAVFLLATMVMFVKVAGDMGVHALESLFYRFLFGFIFIFIWVSSRGQLREMKTKRLPLHFFRTIAGVIAMGLTFSATLILQLPEFATFQFTFPIMVTIMSIIFLKEQVGVRRWTAMIIGFLGVLIVVQPGQNIIPLNGALMALGAVFTASYAFILIKHLSTTESSTRIVFWFTLLAIPILAVAMIFVGQAHAPIIWPIMMAIALCGALGQIALSESIKYAPIFLTAPIDYSHLIWSTLFGFLIWGFWPGLSIWTGAPIIITSGLYVALRSEKKKSAG